MGGTPAAGTKAFEIISEKYTPSILQRSALPLAGITALLMNPEEEEFEEYGDFLTGEELLAENPERFMIDVSRPEREDTDFVVPYEDYYNRPMFAAKGGVAETNNTPMFASGLDNLMNNISPMEDGGAAVPNKYKGFSKLPEAVQQKISPKLAERFAKGGVSFPRRTGGIGPGEGSGTKDDVPAMLMDGEFVMTRDAVKGVGNGNLNKGISRMYNMMDKFERMA